VLYGTTGQGGGPYDRGSVFRLLSDGKVQIVYSFSASHADGQEPMGSLIDVNGTLYGTTELGGAYGLGTVFALTPSGSETILHSFSGYDADCAEPESSLVSVNGMLYGTAVGGGPADRGCVFSVTPSGTETVLHFFGSTKGDGIEAAVGLTYLNGELYGVTEAGGAFNGGTVFQMTLTGAESVLYSFPTGSGGSETPLFAAGGLLYGATIGRDTAANYGTVFSITPAGTESVLYSFTGTPDGAGPLGSLAQIGERLYGTTDVGGATNHGSVYSVLP